MSVATDPCSSVGVQGGAMLVRSGGHEWLLDLPMGSAKPERAAELMRAAATSRWLYVSGGEFALAARTGMVTLFIDLESREAHPAAPDGINPPRFLVLSGINAHAWAAALSEPGVYVEFPCSAYVLPQGWWDSAEIEAVRVADLLSGGLVQPVHSEAGMPARLFAMPESEGLSRFSSLVGRVTAAVDRDEQSALAQ